MATKRAYRKRAVVLKKSIDKYGNCETKICARCFHEKNIKEFSFKRSDVRRKTCEECLDKMCEISLKHKVKLEKIRRQRLEYKENDNDLSNYSKIVKNNKTYIIL